MEFIKETQLKGILKIAPLSNKGESSLNLSSLTDDKLLRPLTDIVDICGTNPTTISYSINTNSSDESGRTSDLTMHKDILGRVRSWEINFPPLTKQGYQKLQELLFDMTEYAQSEIIIQKNNSNEPVNANNSCNSYIVYGKLVNESTGWCGTINAKFNNSDGTYTYSLQDYYNKIDNTLTPNENDLKALNVSVSSNNITISCNSGYKYTYIELNGFTQDQSEEPSYTIWYLIEFMSPEMNRPIRDIVYVGDSSFTGIEPFYKPNITYDTNGMIKTIDEIYVKNVKVNLVSKDAKPIERYNYE